MSDNLLVANPGSSSLKLRVIGAYDEVLATHDGPAPDGHVRERVAAFLGDAPSVRAAGVRVVHGGAEFRHSLVVDDEVAGRLEALDDLAPLHNPASRLVIAGLRRIDPSLPVVACFDTAFHHTIPDAAAVYAVPWRWTTELGVRRFGFHGLSHQWAAGRAAALLRRPLGELRLVTCHLGAGASLAAIAGGRSVDTTMGFTPLEGLVMATRSGSVDPGALLWLQRREGVGPAELERVLGHESGLLALSARSGDLREILAAEGKGDERAGLAVAVYLHRLRGAMAAMAAALGGADAFVFTGGVGEHAAGIRARALDGLAFLGAELDPDANDAAIGIDADISATGARASTLVVAAREDLQIAAAVRKATGRGIDPVPR